METSARHRTIGAFVLVVTLAAFGFLSWINRSGGLQHRDTYLVRFAGPVPGLQPRAAVLFNGLRVGEVLDLRLDSADPAGVIAVLGLAKGMPVRADTKVGIDAPGMMGTPVVVLRGQTATSPMLAARDGQPPTLTADADAGRSLTDAARGALLHVDTILTENASSLRETISNLRDFSGALSRNSNKIDTLFAGLERLTGAGPTPPPPPVYDLAAPRLAGMKAGVPAQLDVPEPTAVLALQTQRLLVRSADGHLTPTGTMQWSDTLPKLVQAKLVQSFDDVGLPAMQSATATAAPDSRQLQLDLRAFDLLAGKVPTAEITLSAKIMSGDGKIVKARVFHVECPSSGAEETASVHALNSAFAALAQQLTSWIEAGS